MAANWIVLAIASLALLAAFGFAASFFPFSPRLAGFASVEDDGAVAKPAAQRLVFMVIDAMRYDFIASSDQMPFTRSLLDRGDAALFRALAQSPTVTLPRLKALTTGTIPSFADVIFNFGVSKLTGDSWLYQLKQLNKKMHFFGDDTWLRLFPNYFDRSDGTASFFVADTVEVDLNVTRHVKFELEKPDWDVLIFHYLGLDHIGHLVGPQSALMPPKQREMDAVIGLIWEILKADKDQPTLFVLCSDHGMTELGNHGGASELETSSFILFSVPGFQHKYPTLDISSQTVWRQVDIVPSICALLGLPIPRNSVGRIVSPLIQWLIPDKSNRLTAIRQNSLQLCRLYAHKTATNFDSLCKTAENHLGDLSIEQHFRRTLYQDQINSDRREDSYFGLFEQVTSDLIKESSVYSMTPLLFLWMFLILLLVVCIYQLASFLIDRRFALKSQPLPSVLKWLLVFWQIVLHPCLLLSSSFVEEEQYVWAFECSTYILAFTIYNCFAAIKVDKPPLKPLISGTQLLVILRFLRFWNPVGNKWSDLPSLRSYLATPVVGIPDLTWSAVSLVLACLLIIKMLISDHQQSTIRSRTFQTTFDISGVAAMLIYKIQANPELWPHTVVGFFAQNHISISWIPWVVYISAFHHAFFSTTDNRLRSITHSFVLVATLLHRPHNALAIWVWSELFIKLVPQLKADVKYPAWVHAALFYGLGQLAFFSLGNSNSIATVDVAGAYTGLSNFNFGGVGFLLFLLTFTGPLLALLGLLHQLHQQSQLNDSDIFEVTAWICAAFVSSLSVYSGIMLQMRHHLFIWTVFSPKYLYMLFFACLNVLQISVLLLAPRLVQSTHPATD